VSTPLSPGEQFAALRTALQRVSLELASAPLTDVPVDLEAEPTPAIDESEVLRALRSFDDRIVHPDLITLCRLDFIHERYADATRKATQYLSQDVLDRCKSELLEREAARAAAASKKPSVLKDGVPLMQQVFALDDPVLRIPPQMQTAADQSEQLGYGNLMQGVIGAFRNPRSHDVFFEDDPLHAILIIELAQHLVEVSRGATLIEAS
jgi:uncharacterized protein (TIGR02391 family)